MSREMPRDNANPITLNLQSNDDEARERSGPVCGNAFYYANRAIARRTNRAIWQTRAATRLARPRHVIIITG